MHPWLVLVVVTTACTYRPGSFASRWYEFPVHRATLGCVDLAVGRVDQSYTSGPVLEYGFGNRCDHRVPLDLATVRVVARDAEGRDRRLVAYDPRRELAALPLIARISGHERIEYRDPLAPYTRIADAICVEVGGVDGSSPHVERWLCTNPVMR